ncbi:1-phosphofructokinase [soil metagenome]
MVLTVTMNPAVDHQIFVPELQFHDTNRVGKTEIDAGGKGINLSRVYAELGGKTIATGFIGGALGQFVRTVLENQGVTCDFVEVPGQTRLNISIEDDSGRPPTTFNEKGPLILAADHDGLLEAIHRNIIPGCWVCLGGSLPAGVKQDVYLHLGKLVKELGCKLLLDADKEPGAFGMQAMPDFIKPNEKEAGRLLGRTLETTDDIVRAAIDLQSQLRPDALVVISRGEKGAVLASPDGVFVGESAPVEAKSTIGSGDSFLAGMLWAMEEAKVGLVAAFRWGLAAGAATAVSDGTEIGHRNVCHVLFDHTSVTRV